MVGDFGQVYLMDWGIARIEAVNDVTVVVIKSQYFEEELQAGSWLGPFIHALAERFREADQKANSCTNKLKTKHSAFFRDTGLF